MDETPEKPAALGQGRPALRPIMRQVLCLAALAAVLAAGLVLAAVLGLRFWPGTAMPVLERALARAGVRVHVQALDLRLFPLAVEARGLTLETGPVQKTGPVWETGQAGPGLRLRAERMAVLARPWLGLGGGPVLEALEVGGLDADLVLARGTSQGLAKDTGGPLDTALDYLDLVDRLSLSGALRVRGQGQEAVASGQVQDARAADQVLDVALSNLVLTVESGPDKERALRLDADMDLNAGLALAGTVGLEARVRRGDKAWGVPALEVSSLEVSSLDVALTDFQAALGPGVWAAGRRAWLQAGLSLEGAGPRVQRAHLALEEVACRVRVGTREGEETAGVLDLEAEARTRGRRLEVDNCRLLVTGLEAAGLGLDLPDLALRAQGGLNAQGPDPAAWTARLDHLDLRLGDLLEAQGSAESAPGLGGWRVDLSGRAERAGAVLDLLRPLLPKTLAGLALSGPLPVRARLDPDQGLAVIVEPGALRLRLPGQGLSMLVDGDLDLRLPLAGQAWLAGTLAATGAVRAAGLGLRKARLRARLDGPLDRLNLPELRLAAPEGGLDWQGAVLPLGRADLRCAASWADGSLEVRDLDLNMAGLGRVRGQLDLPLANVMAGHGRLAAQGLDLSGAGRVLQALGLLPKDAPLLGGQADLSLALDQDRGPILAMDAAWRDVALALADQSVLADKGAGRVSARVRPAKNGRFEADLALTSGQVLAGTVFVDLAATPLTLRARASGDGAGGLADASGVLEMAGLGVMDLYWGALTRPAPGQGTWTWAGRARLRDLRLPGLLETFVRQPLAFTHPDLAGLTAQGDLSLDISLAVEPEAWTMAGRLVLAGGEAAWEAKGVRAKGLEANLPFAYVFGPKSNGPGPEPPVNPAQWGRLACASLATPTGTIEGLDLGLALIPGGLFTRGRVLVPVLGGRLELGDVRVAEPLSPRFLARLPVRLEGVDLALLRPAGVPLEGRLSGDLGLVTIGLDRLSAPGTLSGTFFRGELSVTGLGMVRPLDQGRVTGIGRARVQGLDLERLSAALDLGRVTGRMDIELDDAAVAWGQPQRLNLRILSAPVPGVPQVVSLKAVNSISVIGTGSGLTGAGVGMFASFFKEFGYERIGIACSLRNDVFIVRGLIRQAGREYLIKKPLLFGINVINQNPDNRISFSDMMERIGRVTGGPSGKGPGPKESP